MCAYGNRQHFSTDGREILIGFTVCFKRGLVFTRRTTTGTRRQQPTLPLRYHVEEIVVWIVLLEPPQPFHCSGHVCTVVLTRTHPCDDPARQDGEPSKRQLVLCVVASACVVVLLCGRHVRGQ